MALSRLLPALVLGSLASLVTLVPGEARGQTRDFQVNRYEPTPAGEWSFMVDHPWYSSLRYFAAGVTLNYGHNPLIIGRRSADGTFTQTDTLLAHQLIGHVDLAGSFLDRITLSASLPVIFLERGQAGAGFQPIDGVGVGDPRFSVFARLFGQPDRSPISLNLGAYVWVPLRSFSDSPNLESDRGFRILPRLVLAGLARRLRWSFLAGFYYRSQNTLGQGNIEAAGRSIGSELQLGASLQYADVQRRFAIGPEALMSTVVLGGEPFTAPYTSLELLLGAQYNIAKVIQVGLAGGVGILRTPGTPDARALLRIAYAPIRETAAPDRDRDGVPDKTDVCPDVPRGPRPDLDRPGCPIEDRDSDGIVDSEDLCPTTPQGRHPDPNKRGCPAGDKDGDGVVDPEDQCPEQAMGATPDPNKRGCPAGDKDGDGVVDPLDQCPDTPDKPFPDPNKKGCPLPDRDRDTVSDPVDACPDQPGAPSSDPKKNGCPGLVVIQNGLLTINKPVFFATNKDVILKKSFPVLKAMGEALKSNDAIKKVRIEGHTDNRGDPNKNIDLSERRAKSVMKWLIDSGIPESRLTSKGYGPNQPIAPNDTEKDRAKNRRVDFRIIDPPLPEATPSDAKAVESPHAKDTPEEGKKGKKGKKDKKDKAEAKGDAAKDGDAPAEGKKKRPRSKK